MFSKIASARLSVPVSVRLPAMTRTPVYSSIRPSQVHFTTRSAKRSPPAPVMTACVGQQFRDFKEKCYFGQRVHQKWQSWFVQPIRRHVESLKSKNSQDYPMTEIRENHAKVAAPGAPDVVTDMALLQRYLKHYQTEHEDSVAGFLTLAGIVAMASAIMFLPFSEFSIKFYLAGVLPLNLTLWYKVWYHNKMHSLVSLKLVSVDHQLGVPSNSPAKTPKVPETKKT